MCDYGSLKGCAVPGGLGDSGDYNIDGRCFTENFDHEFLSDNADRQQAVDGEIACGKIVCVNRIVDGYKEISCVFNTTYDVPYGVAMHSPLATIHSVGAYDSELLHYMPDEPISVITHGRAWVLTDTIEQAPAFGSTVYVSQTGFAQTKGNRSIQGWTFTGGFFKYTNVYSLVEVNIDQSAGHFHVDNRIPVNGVHLTRSPEGDLQYNTQVLLTAEVSPVNATDKTGTWHLVNPIHGEIKPLPGNQAQFTPTRSLIGEVTIVWQANDGSDVSGMVKIKYVP